MRSSQRNGLPLLMFPKRPLGLINKKKIDDILTRLIHMRPGIIASALAPTLKLYHDIDVEDDGRDRGPTLWKSPSIV